MTSQKIKAQENQMNKDPSAGYATGNLLLYIVTNSYIQTYISPSPSPSIYIYIYIYIRYVVQ